VMQIAQRGKGQVSREDVRRLTEALEAVAGRGAPASPRGDGTEPRPPT
jgi:hypothetical protein